MNDNIHPRSSLSAPHLLLSVVSALILAGCGSEPVSRSRPVAARLRTNAEGITIGARLLNIDADDAELRKLAEIETLEEVSIQECDAIDGSGFDKLAQLPQLKTLKVVLTPVTDEGLSHLAQASRLEILSLVGVPISDAGLEALAKCTKLRELKLEKLEISDAALVHLAGLNQLETLSLANCKQLTGSGLPQLAKLENLTTLNIQGTGILPDGSEHLGSLSQLRELQLEPQECTDEVVSDIARLSQLERLALVGAPITDQALQALATLEALRQLELSSCRNLTNNGLSHFRGHPRLQLFDLSDCQHVSDECAETLVTIPSLKQVILNDTAVTPNGARAIKEGLPNCTVVFGAAPNTSQL